MTRESRDTKWDISSICREFYQIIHLTSSSLSPETFSSVMHVWSSAISIICREMKLLLPLRNILSHFDVHISIESFELCTKIARNEKLNAKTFSSFALKAEKLFYGQSVPTSIDDFNENFVRISPWNGFMYCANSILNKHCLSPDFLTALTPARNHELAQCQ